MTANSRPWFTNDWPQYAVWANIAFWIAFILMLSSLAVSAVSGLVTATTNILLFGIVLVAGFCLGVSAVFSGKLYRGNEIFTKTPTTGWLARVYGAFLAAGCAVVLLFGWALTTYPGR